MRTFISGEGHAHHARIRRAQRAAGVLISLDIAASDGQVTAAAAEESAWRGAHAFLYGVIDYSCFTPLSLRVSLVAAS